MSDNELDQKRTEFKTTCNTCVFATWNDEYTQQIGCELGRLDKFKEKGQAELIEDKAGFSYYHIKRFCSTCRDENWSKGLDNPVASVLSETKVRADIIIYDNEDSPVWKENVHKSLDGVYAQTIKPRKIIIGFYKKLGKLDTIKIRLNNEGIRNEIVNVIKECPIVNPYFDELIRKCHSTYYILCKSGEVLEPTAIERLNHLINHDLDFVSMIEPYGESLTGLTVQTLLHNTVGGNNNITIQEKIKELATNQNSIHMIKKWQNIY